MQQHDQTIFRQIEAELLLRGVSGATFGKTFPMLGSMVIGRDPACDITIPSDEISRQHARIITRPGSILLEDMGSSNGTYVNNKPIQTAVVQLGDEVRFDKIRFKVLSLSEADEFMTERDYEPAEKTTPPAQETAEKSSTGAIILFLVVISAAVAAAVYFLY